MRTKNRDFAACERALIEEQQQTDALRADNDRLRAAVTDLGVAHIQAQTEVERLRAVVDAARQIAIRDEFASHRALRDALETLDR